MVLRKLLWDQDPPPFSPGSSLMGQECGAQVLLQPQRLQELKASGQSFLDVSRPEPSGSHLGAAVGSHISLSHVSLFTGRGSPPQGPSLLPTWGQ